MFLEHELAVIDLVPNVRDVMLRIKPSFGGCLNLPPGPK
jgi:hypothetical protein